MGGYYDKLELSDYFSWTIKYVGKLEPRRYPRAHAIGKKYEKLFSVSSWNKKVLRRAR
jgi:hypothetical protein